MRTIFELRQYTLLPGRRDDLIGLFEQQFVETQEDQGISVLGTFYDRNDADRFVWLRGFADIDTRATSLAGFYYGPVWQEHRGAANATILDSDDVVMMECAVAAHRLRGLPAADRPPAGAREPGDGWIWVRIVTCVSTEHRLVATAAAPVADALERAMGVPVAAFVSSTRENTFPALPVRTGESSLVTLARFDSEDAYLLAAKRADADPDVRRALLPVREALASEQVLELQPTPRSLIR